MSTRDHDKIKNQFFKCEGYSERVEQLRLQMAEHHLDFQIITIWDEFLSEYTPDYANLIKYLTGFSGSNGMIIASRDNLAFFTDGRYLLQAQYQLKGFDIYDISQKSMAEWFKKNIKKNDKIGFDGSRISYKRFLDIKSMADSAEFINLVLEKYQKPRTELMIHDVKYTGIDYKEKLKIISNQLNEYAHIITNPESVCWLLNLRARDIECNPVGLMRAILYKDSSLELFSDAIINEDLSNYLGDIKIFDLDKFYSRVEEIANEDIVIDYNSSNYNIVNISPSFKHRQDPILLAKAIKNEKEIQGAINAHIKDGVALAKFLYWLENSTEAKTEISVSDKLLEFRKEDPEFLYPSFPTIAGFNSNGAIIHYHADIDTNKEISSGILLIDSGGQYFCGTTDITRTIAIGLPTKEQKENFTRVLKGHIALANARFPIGTTGAQLDVLARYHLWQNHLDYEHGTGHGVGSFLNVHEGPQSISKHSNNVALEEGMILSNEPGYYKKGEYGIRIENLVIVRRDQDYLFFETITLAPIDKKLIAVEMLDNTEINWLKTYHQKIEDIIGPYKHRALI